MLAVAILLGILGGHALIRAVTSRPESPPSKSVPRPGGSTAPPASARLIGPVAGGDLADWPRDLEVFVMPYGCWGRVVCSDSGPGGCWVGVRLRGGRLAAVRDFELTR